MTPEARVLVFDRTCLPPGDENNGNNGNFFYSNNLATAVAIDLQ